jgi:hypothetical protein
LPKLSIENVHCTIALSADTKEELLQTFAEQRIKVHGFDNTPEFREIILKEFKEGPAPA